MKKADPRDVLMETPGLTEKPLFRIQEVCKIFQVSRQTIYDWVKHGKLKPLKVRSRVYFLAKDIQDLLNTADISKIK
ncbi:MAG: helix-turn-helix domain-containing protein [Flavisolibacter sp.]